MAGEIVWCRPFHVDFVFGVVVFVCNSALMEYPSWLTGIQCVMVRFTYILPAGAVK